MPIKPFKRGLKILLGLLLVIIFSGCWVTDGCKMLRTHPSSNKNYTVCYDDPTNEYRLISEDTLRIVYKELYENPSLTYTIYQGLYLPVQSNLDAAIPIRYGMNYIKIPLLKNKIGRHTMYQMVITDKKNQKQYLRFYLK